VPIAFGTIVDDDDDDYYYYCIKFKTELVYVYSEVVVILILVVSIIELSLYTFGKLDITPWIRPPEILPWKNHPEVPRYVG